MRLNDQVIRVVMLYSDEIVFTTGDIVFNTQNYLYKCVQDQPQKGTGIVSPYFTPFLDVSLNEVIKTSEDFDNDDNNDKPVSVGLVHQLVGSYFQGYSTSGAISDFPLTNILECTVNSRYLIPTTGNIDNLPTVLDRSLLNVLDTVVIDSAIYYQLTSINQTDNTFSVYIKSSPTNDWMTYNITDYQQLAQQIITASTENYTQNTNQLNTLIADMNTKIGKIKILDSNGTNSVDISSILDRALDDSLFEFHFLQADTGVSYFNVLPMEDIKMIQEDDSLSINLSTIGTISIADSVLTISLPANGSLRIYLV